MTAIQMSEDQRITHIRHLDMVYTVPRYPTLKDWLKRAAELKKHILVSCGLWPMPPRTPLNVHIFGRIERDGYSVEKVYLESYPGFYVAGNLYRPLGKKGPFPAVLCPHGHWANGRLADEELGSIPGRCIGFARQGYVAFSHDMVGYNDSFQVSHKYGSERENLWGISLMGLQLWNSIRALDFLASLPDVDRKRLACTGESGGGTQTYMLTAVDDRVKVTAPVNMVSAHMQGGCLCENAPGLRLDTCNVELAALAAPRPMMLVSCTGDWTKNTPQVEYPVIRDVYRLFGAEERVSWVQFQAEHNYNKDSREAVYGWFARWLLNDPDPARHKEQPFKAEKPEDLLVFAHELRPAGTLDEAGLTRYLISQSQKQLEDLRPRDESSLKRFRREFGVSYRHTLYVTFPSSKAVISQERDHTEWPEAAITRLYLGRQGEGDRVPAMLVMPKDIRGKIPGTLVVHPQGGRGLVDLDSRRSDPLVAGLLQKGQAVLLIDAFQTGEAAIERKINISYFTTYNLTDTANRVQDILTALSYLKGLPKIGSIHLVGLEEAGLWCWLARPFAPGIGKTIVDVSRFENRSDESYLHRLFVPGLRRAGDFATASALMAPGTLYLHNTGGVFDTAQIADIYRAAGAESKLQILEDKATVEKIIEWVSHGQ